MVFLSNTMGPEIFKIEQNRQGMIVSFVLAVIKPDRKKKQPVTTGCFLKGRYVMSIACS
jgi:hypothetical protein